MSQCIEVAKMQNRPLWLAFLDIKAAYDNVDRERLWSILEDEGVGAEFISLLRELYRENQVQIVWEGVTYNRPV